MIGTEQKLDMSPAWRSLARAKRLATNGLIVGYVGAIAIWLLPSQNLLVARLQNAVRPAVQGLGFWQCWDMFAPKPESANVHLVAHIVYADGTTTDWDFPNAARMGHVERFLGDRRRKWVENLADNYCAAWGEACLFVAREHVRPGKPLPVQVALVRHTLPIPPPEEAFAPSKSLPSFLQRPHPETVITLFQRTIGSEELRP